jgi:hypothetical protein
MVEQTFTLDKCSVNLTTATFSFTLTSSYNGVTERNQDTYTIDLGKSMDINNLSGVLENTQEIQELKVTCANALMGIPLELPEGYGGE